ncbi:hypothetical protein [Tritonibacter mobilis]|uniref:hypothetical protein n=1 Tax=Tritonibacter mobilis TaxID=379347 RepID=UPI0008069F25|nr:hypothetical protein [Tritonibacter mobilis]
MPLEQSNRYKLHQPVVETDEFIVGFPVFGVDDLTVYVDGVLNGQYSVVATFTNGRSDDAVIQLVTAVSGVDVEIYGTRIPRRDDDYIDNSPALAQRLQEDADRLTAVQQEQARDYQSSIRVAPNAPVVAPLSGSNDDRADRVIAFNETGFGLTLGPKIDEIAAAQGYAEDASTSAAASEASATASAESASAAASSATDASNSAGSASSSATSAAGSATAASNSATAAGNSATAAETAESGAATSASNAGASASAASTSATQAAASASDAATSESNAASSASAASTSATNAADSATAAAGSATAAAASATEAQGYADTWAGVGTIATQDANAVNIDGGSVDGVTIGANAPATATFLTASLSANAPALDFSELDSDTYARVVLDGGILFIQVGEPGQGADSGSGDLRFSGAFGADIDNFQVRSGGTWKDIIHQNYVGSLSLQGAIAAAAAIDAGLGARTETTRIDIGRNRTGNGFSQLDLIGDTTYTDYGTRLLRNPGASGKSQLLHRGTGRFELRSVDGADIALDFTDASGTEYTFKLDSMQINRDLIALEPGGAFFSNDPGGVIQPVLRQAGRAFFGPNAYNFTGATRGNNPTANSWVHSGDEGNNFFNPSATTTLDAAIGDANSFISIADSSGFPISGHAKVGDEIVSYTGVNYATHTLTGAVRGQLGTTASAHGSGTDVHVELSPYGSRIQYAQTNARVYSEANGGIALTGAATNEVRDAIGVFPVARLDSGGAGTKVWAGYPEAIRGEGTTGVGSVWATEIAVMNFATPHSVKGAKPSGGFLGQTHGLLIQTGGGNTNAENSDNPLIIGKGGASFYRGIVFYENSIANPDGEQAEAVLLPQSYCMTWYASGGTDRVFDIRSDISAAANAQDLVFSNGGMTHRHRLGNTLFSSYFVANSVNFPQVRPSVAGQPIQLRAEGTDTNIDMLLKPKGNGNVINDNAGVAATLHTWRVDLGANTRSCSLFGPEADNAVDPFIWATGNSWLFRVDTIDALSIDGNGDVVVPTSDFMVGKTSLGGSTAGVELHPTGLINATVSENVVARFNRLYTDGQIVVFQQDSVPEGDITVSGTTVSYNNFMGAHYSELDAAKGKKILRGTIVEATGNLVDQRHTRQERLSKFRVCDTPGSKAVYGVIDGPAIQDKDELYPDQTEWEGKRVRRRQYMIAAVGAGFIRIKKGETVKVGDLIENAGGGVGRAQADDTIRSSTVAKITSTHVVTEYRDGSTLVPCVLYCG